VKENVSDNNDFSKVFLSYLDSYTKKDTTTKDTSFLRDLYFHNIDKNTVFSINNDQQCVLEFFDYIMNNSRKIFKIFHFTVNIFIFYDV
jgi:hypothetical protein